MEQATLTMIEERLHAAAELRTDTPTRLVPENMKVVSLEEYQEHRSNYRGTFQTLSIADFARYAADFEGGKCFINQQDMKATCFFDLGDEDLPGHGRHRAHLALEKTAAFEAMLSRNGYALSQKDMAEWLEDWRDHITPVGADDVKKAIQAVRNITISANASATHVTEDFRGTRSVAEEIEAKGVVQLPTGFTFECFPYHGLNERTFTLRLSVLTGDKPTLVLRLARWEEQQEAMAQEFSEHLGTALKSAGADASIFLGSFAP